MKTILLTKEAVREIALRVGLERLLDELFESVWDACLQFDESACQSPARAGFNARGDYTGLVEWMPYQDGAGKTTVKIVGYHPENPGRFALPTIASTVARFDESTGRLTALADGTFLTAIRTGAASAVASRILADPGSATLGLIGCGAQAVTQLHALSRIFPLRRVLLYDVAPHIEASFPKRIARLGLNLESVDSCSPEEILRESDIVCTATSVEVGRGPVVQDRPDIRPGLHINAVGSDLPGKTELPASLLRRAFVCADFPDQAFVEGECQQLERSQLDSSLAELVRNAVELRNKQSALTVFDSTGWSLEDHVALDILTRHALRLGLGEAVEIDTGSSDDPWDPYEFLAEPESEPQSLECDAVLVRGAKD